MALIISGRRMTNTGTEMSKSSEIYNLHGFRFGFLGGFFTQKQVSSGNDLESLILCNLSLGKISHTPLRNLQSSPNVLGFFYSQDFDCICHV